MSFIDFPSLKSSKDLDIPFLSDSEIIALVTINHDTLIEQGLLVKSLRLVNDDGTNNLDYRTGSPSGTLKSVPPNSEVTIDGWFSIFQVFPNAVTGQGLIETDLVSSKDAQRDNLK